MVSSSSQQFIGIPTLEFEELASTNNYALNLISKSNPTEGTAVFAVHQTHGKGQFDRVWHASAYESLTVSIIIKPRFIRPNQQFYLNIISSLAVAQLLEEYLGYAVTVKWPNDIYIGKKKVAGILIQNILTRNLISYSVVGIGINVNQGTFPGHLPNPVSLKIAAGKSFDLLKLRADLFQYFEKNYLLLKSSEWKLLKKKYLSCLYLINQNTIFKSKTGDTFTGKIIDIDDIGRLKMKVSDTIISFQFNEFEYTL